MKLYHASYCIIDHPDIFHSRDLLDFGKGFYLTLLKEQAQKYAQRFIVQDGLAYINSYELNEDLSGFTPKFFTSYDEEWLDFCFSLSLRETNSTLRYHFRRHCR